MSAPFGNKNAEKWDLDESKSLYEKAIKLSLNDEYDFIGEVARDLGIYRQLFKDLIDKFPELKKDYNLLISNLEANCFQHAKKGKIKEATAIVNLKSNHNWTDRQENNNNNKTELNITVQDESTKDELNKLINEND